MDNTTRFVVFHTGADALPTYLPLMKVSQEALAVTNPGARYIVLTDRETAPYLEKDFEVEVLAPHGWPLMRQYVEAQRLYEAKAESGLTVLAATDCVANRDLGTALKHPMAVTYRMRGRHLINNIAYVRDHELAAWFLKRCLHIMKPASYDMWGDQESWQDVLGEPKDWAITDYVEGEGRDDLSTRLAIVEGRSIYLYPCITHNYFNKYSGAFSATARQAYLLHFKGSRKQHMVASVNHYILKKELEEGEHPTNWKICKLDRRKRDLPMQARREKIDGPHTLDNAARRDSPDKASLEAADRKEQER